MPAAASEGQKRLPGRAKGALTAVVHGLGLMPTMSRRTGPSDSASPGSGSTSSRAGPSDAAASWAGVGRAPASGGGRRQGRQGRQAAGRRDSEPRGAVGDMGPA